MGLKELLNLLSEVCLSPADIHRTAVASNENEVDLEPHEDGQLVAQVFKTTNDLFMGKISYLRILTGRMANDTMLVNLRTGRRARSGTSIGFRGRHKKRSRKRSPATSSRWRSSTTCTSPIR